MLELALLFLIIALAAGALGVFDVAIISTNIAWVLFIVFMILFAISLVFGRPWSTGPPV